jgi:endonuclease/exonuclease/phosphatase family metal-dependent hydrolase
MKLLKNIVRAGALCGLFLSAATASAQKVQLKVMDWNVLSFEMTDKSNQITFDIDQYVTLIKAQDPDILCLNELESGTSRMGKEKLVELATRLDMFPYYIMSYPKDVGYYGNGILSKYPIIATGSKLISYKHYLGEGNYQFNNDAYTRTYGADQRSVGYADILVPTSDSEGQVVRIVCSHLDHQINSSGKIRQAQEVADFIGLNEPAYPTVLMGDMNVGSASSIPAISEPGDLIYSLWVDFIFTYPKNAWTKISGTYVDCGKLSDHDPVIGVISLK